jgi:hypothetical protein
MEIDINQQKISIGDKYKIFIDGKQKYIASRQLLSLLPVVYLYELDSERVRMTINKLFSWLWRSQNLGGIAISVLRKTRCPAPEKYCK